MSSNKLVLSIVLAVILPVVLLSWPVASMSVDATAKAVALMIPALISLVIAGALWGISKLFSKNR